MIITSKMIKHEVRVDLGLGISGDPGFERFLCDTYNYTILYMNRYIYIHTYTHTYIYIYRYVIHIMCSLCPRNAAEPQGCDQFG